MQISYIEEVKRKLVHLSSLWMVAATLLLADWQYMAAALFGALLLLTLVSEHDYANGGRYLGRLYGKLFGKWHGGLPLVVTRFFCVGVVCFLRGFLFCVNC